MAASGGIRQRFSQSYRLSQWRARLLWGRTRAHSRSPEVQRTPGAGHRRKPWSAIWTYPMSLVPRLHIESMDQGGQEPLDHGPPAFGVVLRFQHLGFLRPATGPRQLGTRKGQHSTATHRARRRVEGMHHNSDGGVTRRNAIRVSRDHCICTHRCLCRHSQNERPTSSGWLQVRKCTVSEAWDGGTSPLVASDVRSGMTCLNAGTALSAPLRAAKLRSIDSNAGGAARLGLA